MTAEAVPTIRVRRGPLVAAGAGAILLAGAGFAVHWALGTCNALDRLFGISGCVAAAEVAAFSPLLWDTIVMPRDGGDISVFGKTETIEGWRPALVRLSLADGREHGRFPLAMSDVEFMKASADRTRVFLSCRIAGGCNEQGGSGLIAAVADGATIDPNPAPAATTTTFPGDPAPTGDIAWDAVVLPGGAIAAETKESTGEIVLRRMADGGEVRRLAADPDLAISRSGFALVPSPSGRYIAGIDTLPPPRLGYGAIIRIWDVESGREVGRIGTDEGHELQRDLAWTPDERQVVALRMERDGDDVTSWVETYDWGAPAS